MKKIALSLLLIVICVGFVGCGKKNNTDESTKADKGTVEYKDFDNNGKIDFLDKTYAISQAGGLNIEYKVTSNGAVTNHKLIAKDNMLSILNETDNSGRFYEFVDLGGEKKGNFYKKENGVWKSAGTLGFSNTKENAEELKRKDIYIYVDRLAGSMDKYLITEKYKAGEVTYLDRKCTKYEYKGKAGEANEGVEKTIYVDNETEMPLYFKDNTRSLEVTKFENKVDLSVPQVNE